MASCNKLVKLSVPVRCQEPIDVDIAFHCHALNGSHKKEHVNRWITIFHVFEVAFKAHCYDTNVVEYSGVAIQFVR